MSSDTTASSNAVGSSTAPVSTISTMATLLEAANEVVNEDKGSEKQLAQATQDIIEKVSAQSQEENKIEEEKSAYKDQDKIKSEETKFDH